MANELRPHQREAVDAVLRALDLPAARAVTARGLRTQVIMATGSWKTRMAVRSAEELHAGRVLVLVPSLDLLAQTETAWREGGRGGPMIGVSSLRGEEASFPNTTDVSELVEWTRGLEKVTVYATYASLGLGTLEKAHQAGLAAGDLIVVDEAHRTSGRIGKPWHRPPAARPFATTSTVPNTAVTASTSTSSIPSNTSESQNGASVCMTSTITVHNRRQQLPADT
ncbi:DEAD/DEAH box helicase family protein [Streptomyces sp. NPDC051366]|uniref:DEAD/DEAH box helicase family protein n=1 Tax=Streptomyces sp. NPDC051366 TaxID=3365652 RepID=UPI00379BB608